LSVSSQHVYAQVRFSKESIQALLQLTEQAIQRAVQRTADRLLAYATSGQSNVPVKTGRLRSSFSVWTTPRSIKFLWSAIDPKSNYDYAKIQDEGGLTGTGGWIAGKYYSQATAAYAREWLHEELTRELGAMTVP